MPFSIRPFHRFPVCCPVIYHAGLFEGHGHPLESLVERVAYLRGLAAACRRDLFLHRQLVEPTKYLCCDCHCAVGTR
jgi:hypothetical protein